MGGSRQLEEEADDWGLRVSTQCRAGRAPLPGNPDRAPACACRSAPHSHSKPTHGHTRTHESTRAAEDGGDLGHPLVHVRRGVPRRRRVRPAQTRAGAMAGWAVCSWAAGWRAEAERVPQAFMWIKAPFGTHPPLPSANLQVHICMYWEMHFSICLYLPVFIFRSYKY